MSLAAPTHYEAAVEVILKSGAPATDIAQALLEVRGEIAQLRAEHNQAAWAKGCKGDGVVRVDGLTEHETTVLRRFAATTVVLHAEVDDLSRHVCSLRKVLKLLAPGVRIETVQRLGYRLISGFEDVYRLLRGGRSSALGVAGFTPKETVILGLFVEWGNLHKEQVHCLVRHMSNIRKKGERFGIAIDTVGDGLYSADRCARAQIKRLLAGELTTLPLRGEEVGGRAAHLHLVAA